MSLLFKNNIQPIGPIEDFPDIIYSSSIGYNSFICRISINGNPPYVIPGNIYNGQYIFNIKNILRELSPTYNSYDLSKAKPLNTYDFHNAYMKIVPHDDDVEAISIKFFPGYAKDKMGNLIFDKSWGGRIRQTYKWGLEYITCENYIYPYSCERTEIEIVLFTTLKGPINLTLHSIDNSNLSPRIEFLCSYNYVYSLLKNYSGYGDLIAYNIIVHYKNVKKNNTSQTNITQLLRKYTVAHNESNVRGFVFRNSFGHFDVVYSKGAIKTILKHYNKTFKNQSFNNEYENNSIKEYNINTGYIDNQFDYALWEDFFKSSERYIIEQDSGLLKNIVINEVKCENTDLELNSFTFSFQYGEEEPSYKIQKVDNIYETYAIVQPDDEKEDENSSTLNIEDISSLDVNEIIRTLKI